MYGELHILHVAVVVFQLLLDGVQLVVQLRHSLFHRRILACTLFLADTLERCPAAATLKGDLLRGADTCYHVLALCIHKVLTVEDILAGSGIAAEANAGSRGLAHVTEHHRHDGNSGTPLVGYAFHLTIEDSTLVHPAAEHSADCAPQLLHRVGGEVLAGLLFDSRLEAGYEELQLVYIQVLIQLDTANLFYFLDDSLEGVDVLFVDGLHAEHHIAVHLYEAAVGVVNEVGVVGFLGHALCHGVVQTEVEDGVHHTGHGSARTRANADEQRVSGVAELAVHQVLYMLYGSQHLIVQEFHNLLLPYLIVLVAGVGRDGESRRNGHTYQVHLGAVSALSAQHFTHLGITFSLSVSEGVNSFFVVHCLLLL